MLILSSSYFLWWRPGKVHAQTDTFTTSGTWTVPANVSSAVFEAWGGGGAGGGDNVTGGASGGAGGQYARTTLTGLTGSDVYTVTVAVSTGTNSTTSAMNGGDSKVLSPLSSTVVLAKGGAGGSCCGNATVNGSIVGGVGDAVFAGGSSILTSSGSNGSGGGGGAGSTGTGGNGSENTPGTGTSINGGGGGAGATSNAGGSNASNYGGGGGGAFRTNGSTKTGGAGAQGLVTVTYTVVINSAPNAPTLGSPANAVTVTSATPQFQMSTTDTESDHIKYDILIYNTSSNNGTSCTGTLNQENDQNSSQAGWSGQDADTSTTYLSGSTATYTVQAGSALTRGNTYCWQAKAKDPTGSGIFSSLSSFRTFTVNSIPVAPTLSSPSSGATGVSVTPQFQLKTTDADNDYLQYRVYLYQSDCTTAVGSSPFDMSGAGWTGMDANGNTAYAGSSTIASSTMATYTYQGTLSGSTTYCWKADAVDPGGSNIYSSASATQQFTTAAAGGSVTIQGGTDIRGGSTLQ